MRDLGQGLEVWRPELGEAWAEMLGPSRLLAVGLGTQ